MKSVVNRLELLQAAKRAASVAPSASPLEVLKGILVEISCNNSITLSATNLEVAMRVSLPCQSESEDAFVLNAKLFVAMLEKLSGDTVTLSRHESNLQLSLRSGTAFYQVPILGGNCFPQMEIPFPEDTVTVRGIPSIVKRCTFAVDRRSQANKLFKCVNLMFTKDGLRAAGSDGNCVVTAKGDEKSIGDISMMVPANSMDILARICHDKDEFRVGTTGKYIVFMKDTLIFSARIMDGEYIDTDTLIAKLSNKFTVMADIVDLRNTLYSTAAVDPDGSIMLGFNGSQLTAECAGQYAHAINVMDVIPLTGSPQGSHWYMSRQMMECLRVIDGMTTIGIAQNGMLNISTENSYYLQSPMRPPAQVRNAPGPVPKAA